MQSIMKSKLAMFFSGSILSVLGYHAIRWYLDSPAHQLSKFLSETALESIQINITCKSDTQWNEIKDLVSKLPGYINSSILESIISGHLVVLQFNSISSFASFTATKEWKNFAKSISNINIYHLASTPIQEI